MSVMLSPAVEEGGSDGRHFKGLPSSILRISFPKRPDTRQPAGRPTGRRDRFVVVENCNGAFPRKRNGRMAETLLRVSMFAVAAAALSLRISLICSPPRPRVRLTLGALMTCYYGACGRPRLDTRAPAAAERPNLSCRMIGTIGQPGHSGFLKEGDENFQIFGHQNIFSRFVLRGIAHSL